MKVFPANPTMLGFRGDMEWTPWYKINIYKNPGIKKSRYILFSHRIGTEAIDKEETWTGQKNKQVNKGLSILAEDRVPNPYISTFKIKKENKCQ